MKNKKPILAFSCTHAPAMHKGFLPFLQKIYKKHNCGRVVHLGDAVDWASISYHEKDPSMPSAADEFLAAKKQMQQIYKAFPKLDYMMGNHCSLPERKAKLIGLPEEVLCDFAKLWDVAGWTIHPRFSDLVIDDVIFRHGDKGKGGAMAAHKNAIAEFASVVQGHFHAQAGIVYHANKGDCVYGLQVGCGVDRKHPAMNYGRVYAAKPIVGCGVVYSSKLAFFEPAFL
jgi:predicted phosphodiesterase